LLLHSCCLLCIVFLLLGGAWLAIRAHLHLL
jgi:hypothetical protein